MQSLRSWIKGSPSTATPTDRSKAEQALWLQQRASLEGLEVRDSTWDEWVACCEAGARPSAQSTPRSSVQK